MMNKRFHPYLQIPPRTQQVSIPKAESTYRIICLGGSTTEGKEDANYPTFLESLLRKRYPEKNIEVLNAGKYFYNSQSSIIQYLFYLKEFEPDLLIFFHGFNDIMPSFTSGQQTSAPFRRDYGHFYGPLGRLRYPVLFKSYLGSFFFSDITSPEPQAAPFSNFQSLPSYRRNLETIIDLARRDNISLILSNQAHRFSPKNDSPDRILGLTRPFLTKDKHHADEKSWYMAMELFNKTALETAERFGVPMVDQATFFKGKQDLFTDCVHMTLEGTTKKAKLFFEKIVDLKLLK
jgi:lysophospholipase L1-like esterase